MNNISPFHNWRSWIGTDEAGKGDYFGPIVVAGFFVDSEIITKLQKFGVGDSKKISDPKVKEITQKMWSAFPDRIAWITFPPFDYNQKYKTLKRDRKNLNDLLSEMHTTVIEKLTDRNDCKNVIVDQFDEKRMLKYTSHLKIDLIQKTKAETDLAVAAASIVARSVFLKQIRELSNRFDFQFPKGATHVIDLGKQFVEKHGPDALQNVAKLHFRTTSQILDR